MQANPRKFPMITFGIGNTPVALRVHDNEMIMSQKVVNLLGVYIDVLLKFDHHVSHMCSRASNKVNALARLSKSFNEPCKLQLVKTFIVCYCNYCPLVW